MAQIKRIATFRFLNEISSVQIEMILSDYIE